MSVRQTPWKKVDYTLSKEAVGDEEAFYVTHNGRKYFVMGEDMLDEHDFTKQIASRVGDRFDNAWKEALALIEHTDREVLESQRQFYEQIYKPRRDELSKKWSQ